MSADERVELAIAQLTRQPVLGMVKTRMLPALSAERALALHREMTLYMTANLSVAAPLTVWVDGDLNDPLFDECQRLGAAGFAQQPPGSLGERMAFIASHILADARKLVLVGSDAPSLGEQHIARVASALDQADVVLVPAYDGGYVLLGLRIFCPEVFQEIDWGTDRVLQQSLAALDKAQRSVVVLEPEPDIDRPDDLRWLPSDLIW